MKRRLLSRKPLIWFHYVLLIAILFLGQLFATWIGLYQWGFSNNWFGWIALFVYYYVIIAFGDQLIHYILGVD
jgi:hypothetical protein